MSEFCTVKTSDTDVSVITNNWEKDDYKEFEEKLNKLVEEKRKNEGKAA